MTPKVTRKNVLKNLFLRFEAEVIWFVLLGAIGSYFLGTSAPALLIAFIYFWIRAKNKRFFSKSIQYSLFMSLGFFTIYRFDIDKAYQWVINDILPVLVFVIIIFVAPFLFGKLSFISTLFVKGSHRFNLPIILTVTIIANTVTFIVKDRYSIFSGLILILLFLIVFLNSHKDSDASFIGHWMAFVYSAFIHIIWWKVYTVVLTNPIEFFKLYTHTLLLPFLMVGIYFRRIKTTEKESE